MVEVTVDTTRDRKTEKSPNGRSDPKTKKDDGQDAIRKNHDKSKCDKYSSQDRCDLDVDGKERETNSFNYKSRSHKSSVTELQHEPYHKQRSVAPKLSEEERAARLWEMQMDAEVHEEQRWKRLKKDEEEDAHEAVFSKISGGRNFLDAAHKSVYGAEKGGSSTIEESVHWRTYNLQGRSEANEGNAFRG